MTLYGVTGKFLRVDLTSETIGEEQFDESFYRKYMGGTNIAAYFLLKEIPKDIDPLSAENKLVITTSIITGTKIPGSSRFTIAAKSPLTNGFAVSEAGGWWGPELKFAGFDGLIIEGSSKKPVYLWINDGKVEIRDATNLWGKETGEVQKILINELGEKYRILQMGPAGENLVRFANITNELRHFAGRTGLGAVMGSKKLRAIAVRGTERVKVKDEGKINEYARWFAKNVTNCLGLTQLKNLGTAKNVIPLNRMGLLPTYNFKQGTFSEAEKISGEKMKEIVSKKREGCYACPVRCKQVINKKTSSQNDLDPVYGAPEYETIGSLGSNCGINDIVTIAKANELCSRYGLDTISTGITIAFAMECYEKELLQESQLNNVKPEFGNGSALLKLIKMIAFREDIGELLAEGSFKAGKKIGNGAEKISMSVKGQELPAHEPRGKWGVGLGYAVLPTGADHLVAAHDLIFEVEGTLEEEFGFVGITDLHLFGITEPVSATSLNEKKVRLFIHLQYLWSLYNVLDLCIFVGVPGNRMLTLEKLVDLVKAVTSWSKTSIWELVKAGERGITMARAFNVREGLTTRDDVLPERLHQPLKSGSYKGFAIDKKEFAKAKNLYYEMMGWDEEGIPKKGKLVELGIEWIDKNMRQ